MSKSLDTHWSACKRVLRYLKETSNFGLEFRKGDKLDLVSFFDVDDKNQYTKNSLPAFENSLQQVTK